MKFLLNILILICTSTLVNAKDLPHSRSIMVQNLDRIHHGGAKVKVIKAARPSARDSFNRVESWVMEDTKVPDMTHLETVLSLAYMTQNCYIDDPNNPEWVNDTVWIAHKAFGWDGDGLRGYVFSDAENEVFVISIKGTSAKFLWGGGGPSAINDKIQDNTLFSCCCARVDYTWTPVCGCYVSGNVCSQDCLEDAVTLDTSYYMVAMNVFVDILEKHPNAAIWFAGHSLGGSIASLLGLTFGAPTVAFEAPGDMLPAKRLHLPMPPGIDWKDLPMFHVGHTADPIYMGTCNGMSSSCYIAGYAMESRCHTGKVCLYEVAEKWGWRQDIRNHRIIDVIERIIKQWGSIPECVPEKNCEDCLLWEFVS